VAALKIAARVRSGSRVTIAARSAVFALGFRLARLLETLASIVPV
jgi:hypothetical protein